MVVSLSKIMNTYVMRHREPTRNPLKSKKIAGQARNDKANRKDKANRNDKAGLSNCINIKIFLTRLVISP